MNLLSVHEFRIGLAAGSVALVVLLVCSVVSATRYRNPLPLGGLAFAAAGLWSIGQSRAIPAILVLAIAWLAALATFTSFVVVPAWVPYVAALPCGWAIGFHAGVPDIAWVQLLVALVASAGAMLVAATDLEWRLEAPTLALFALTLAGVYVAVPDTEEAAALLGVVVPLALLGWPLCLAALGRAGAAAGTALFVWTAAVGGRGRPASLVGAVACLGLLVGLPLGRALLPPTGRAPARANRLLVLGLMGLVQAGLVFVGARVAGVRHGLTAAVPIAVLVGGLAIIVGAAFQAVQPLPVPASSDEPPRS